MQGIYIIHGTTINLTLVKAIRGNDEFVQFDMVGENAKGAHKYNGYSGSFGIFSNAGYGQKVR